MIIPKSEDFSVFAPSYKCDNAEYDSFISDLQLQTLMYSESTDIIFIQQYPCLNLNRNSGTSEWNSLFVLHSWMMCYYRRQIIKLVKKSLGNKSTNSCLWIVSIFFDQFFSKYYNKSRSCSENKLN